MTTQTISTFSADDIMRHVGELGALLHTCVHDGASIGFIMPFTPEACGARYILFMV